MASIKGATKYTCYIREGGEWVPLFSTHDPREVAEWEARAKANGKRVKVEETEE